MMLPEDHYSELVMRYRQFYGRVAADQNRTIMDLLSGETLVEVGCGYGQFVSQASGDIRAVGADYDMKALQMGKKEFKSSLVLSDSYKLSFADDSFDTVLLRETAHHLDMRRALPEIGRIARKEVVVFDPNPTVIVRLSRRIIGHKDYELPLPEMLKIFDEFGYEVFQVAYRDVIAFPASGGLVGIPLVPNVDWLERLILFIDRIANMLLKSLNLQKYFCWRYIIVARKRR